MNLFCNCRKPTTYYNETIDEQTGAHGNKNPENLSPLVKRDGDGTVLKKIFSCCYPQLDFDQPNARHKRTNQFKNLGQGTPSATPESIIDNPLLKEEQMQMQKMIDELLKAAAARQALEKKEGTQLGGDAKYTNSTAHGG